VRDSFRHNYEAHNCWEQRLKPLEAQDRWKQSLKHLEAQDCWNSEVAAHDNDGRLTL